MAEKSATIQDVARVAGVSTATVSRALSDPKAVTKARRDAVLQAVQSTGYRANRAARNLRMQRSNTILALLPTLGNPFFSQILQGLENVLTPAGQSLVVAETRQILSVGDDLVSYLEDKRADGVIVLDGSVPDSFLANIKGGPHEDKIVFACEWHQKGGFPSVRSANVVGAQMAVKFLHDLGHHRIAHVTGPKENVLTHERIRGYGQTCEELNIEPMLIQGDFTLDAGTVAADEILAMPTRPTAVFCASDVIAFGLIARLSQAGLKVPDDISVVGFDDIELCEHYVPAITSIQQDRVALGAQAAKLLLNRMDRAKSVQSNFVEFIPVKLVPRASSAKSAANANAM